jgi:hypothetical protein
MTNVAHMSNTFCLRAVTTLKSAEANSMHLIHIYFPAFQLSYQITPLLTSFRDLSCQGFIHCEWKLRSHHNNRCICDRLALSRLSLRQIQLNSAVSCASQTRCSCFPKQQPAVSVEEYFHVYLQVNFDHPRPARNFPPHTCT